MTKAKLKPVKINYFSIPGITHDNIVGAPRMEVGKKFITCDQIAEEIANCYDLTMEQFTSKLRKREFVVPRQVYCYICRNHLTPFPQLTKIAKLIHRDHATVLHGVKQIERLLETDRLFKEEMKNIIDRLKYKELIK